eukprot:RCo022390
MGASSTEPIIVLLVCCFLNVLARIFQLHAASAGGISAPEKRKPPGKRRCRVSCSPLGRSCPPQPQGTEFCPGIFGGSWQGPHLEQPALIPLARTLAVDVEDTLSLADYCFPTRATLKTGWQPSFVNLVVVFPTVVDGPSVVSFVGGDAGGSHAEPVTTSLLSTLDEPVEVPAEAVPAPVADPVCGGGCQDEDPEEVPEMPPPNATLEAVPEEFSLLLAGEEEARAAVCAVEARMRAYLELFRVASEEVAERGVLVMGEVGWRRFLWDLLRLHEAEALDRMELEDQEDTHWSTHCDSDKARKRERRRANRKAQMWQFLTKAADSSRHGGSRHFSSRAPAASPPVVATGVEDPRRPLSGSCTPTPPTVDIPRTDTAESGQSPSGDPRKASPQHSRGSPFRSCSAPPKQPILPPSGGYPTSSTSSSTATASPS